MNIRKIDSNSAEFIKEEEIIPAQSLGIVTYEEQKVKWLQAKESVEKQRADFEVMIAPQQATVDLFYAQLMEMEKQGIVTKPVETLKETPLEG